MEKLLCKALHYCRYLRNRSSLFDVYERKACLWLWTEIKHEPETDDERNLLAVSLRLQNMLRTPQSYFVDVSVDKEEKPLSCFLWDRLPRSVRRSWPANILAFVNPKSSC